MNDSGKLLVTLTAGFAAGVVAGVLFAPEAGDATRETIKKKAGELGDELEKHYANEIDKLKDKVAELSKELKDTINESGIKEKAAKMAEDVTDKVNATAANIKEELS